MNKSLVPVLKLAVILFCFGLIYHAVDLEGTLSNLSQVSPLPLLAAFACVLVEPLLMAHRTALLMRQKDMHINVPRLTRLIFTSNFLSVAVPSGVGPDALRLLLLKKAGYSGTHSTSVLLMDRMLSVQALALLSVPGLLVIWNTFPEQHVLWGMVMGIGLIFFLSTLALSTIPGLCLAWAIKKYPNTHHVRQHYLSNLKKWLIRGMEILAAIHASFHAFHASYCLLVKILFWNVINQLLRIVQILLLFIAVGHPVSPGAGLAFVPIIIMVALLPITYFGLGLKEGAFLYFFVQVGIPASICLSVSLLTYLLIFAAMIPGAFFFLRTNTFSDKVHEDKN
jgi:glycosyltransferase 2 family protein